MSAAASNTNASGAPAQMPDITYKRVPVIPEGSPEDFTPVRFEITRTDKDSTSSIAFIENELLEFVSDEMTKFRVPTLRFLNDQNVPYRQIAVKGKKKDKIKEDEPPCPIPAPSSPGKAGYDAYVEYLRDGDKYAPIVEWFKRYRPEEYKVRYGIIGPGEVQKLEGYDTNQKTGEKTPRYRTEDALIATRKIHHTEKQEANDQPASFKV